MGRVLSQTCYEDAGDYLPSEDKLAEEWLKRCEPVLCFLKSGTDPAEIQAEINRRIERRREEMKGWTKQKVDEIFKKYGKPAGKPYEVIKIPKNDEEAYISALEQGFEEVKENGSFYYMRRRTG